MCQLSPAQEEDTAIVSDTTDDLWFLTEGESEQVSVEMKEAALEEGRGGEGEACSEEDDGAGKEEKGDREVCVQLHQRPSGLRVVTEPSAAHLDRLRII